MSDRTLDKTRVLFLGLILLVAIVVGMAWVSLRDCSDLFRRSYHATILGDKEYIHEPVRFRVQADGTSLLANGRLAGFRTVRASDCVDVTTQAEDEGSPLQAEDEMKRRIQGAFHVIERAPIVDPHGKLMGERAILLVQLGQKEPRVEIVAQHKDNSKLIVIRSASLAHALAYEELIQGGYKFDSNGYLVAHGK